jgi:hypothetical protein
MIINVLCVHKAQTNDATINKDSRNCALFKFSSSCKNISGQETLLSFYCFIIQSSVSVVRSQTQATEFLYSLQKIYNKLPSYQFNA